MERREVCKYLGEYVGSARSLQDSGWAQFKCEAPELGPKPSAAIPGKFEDDAIVFVCGFANGTKKGCNLFELSEEVEKQSIRAVK